MEEKNDNFGFRFREWDIYQDARKFRTHVTRLLKTFPSEEKFRLIDQAKRSLNSVVLNIAESANKRSYKEMRLYIDRAHCSLDEVVSCLDCAFDDDYITLEARFESLKLASSLAKRLNGFAAHLTRLDLKKSKNK